MGERYWVVAARLTVAGMLMFPALPAILKFGVNAGVLSWLAEIGLVLLLFTDASRTNTTVLRCVENLAVRLLSVGMLLTILLGAVAARLIFPHLSNWEAGSWPPSSLRPMPVLGRSL
jgi:sodium/hydrogen antiporter